MVWLVKLKDRATDIEELSRLLSAPEICIIQEGQDFFLKSTDFNSLKESGDVLKRANELISWINGATNVAKGVRTPLTSDSVTRINDDGTRQNFVHLSAKVRIRSSVTASASVLKKDGTVHKQRSAEPITDWLSIARHDENVAKVLRLFGSYSLDWVNLYRIYEVIESDIGNTSRIIEEGWATQKAIGRFKHTANSPSVTGDMSRHGKEPTLPPPNLMTISKAESLIRGIFNNWVRSKK